jgi:hypothetical protein
MLRMLTFPSYPSVGELEFAAKDIFTVRARPQQYMRMRVRLRES